MEQKLEGIRDMKKLSEYLVSRAYNKNSDIRLLMKELQWDNEISTAYMDGYVDGLIYCLSLMYPEENFDQYIRTVLNGELVHKIKFKQDLEKVFKPGLVFVAKKISKYTSNLNLVLSSSNNGSDIIYTPIICESTLTTPYNYNRRYELDLVGVPSIYGTTFGVDLDTMYPSKLPEKLVNINNTFSAIMYLSEEDIDKVIKAYEDYDKEMGALYDIAIKR